MYSLLADVVDVVQQLCGSTAGASQSSKAGCCLNKLEKETSVSFYTVQWNVAGGSVGMEFRNRIVSNNFYHLKPYLLQNNMNGSSMRC